MGKHRFAALYECRGRDSNPHAPRGTPVLSRPGRSRPVSVGLSLSCLPGSFVPRIVDGLSARLGGSRCHLDATPRRPCACAGPTILERLARRDSKPLLPPLPAADHQVHPGAASEPPARPRALSDHMADSPGASPADATDGAVPGSDPCLGRAEAEADHPRHHAAHRWRRRWRWRRWRRRRWLGRRRRLGWRRLDRRRRWRWRWRRAFVEEAQENALRSAVRRL
jgi:hypothetical protein